MTVKTTAIVTVELHVQVETTWSDAEPMTRPRKEAEESALATVKQLASKHGMFVGNVSNVRVYVDHAPDR